MRQRITIIMLVSLVTMLAGCSETFSVKKGDQVRFKVATKNSPNTKTSYSNEFTTENGTKYERINWVAGDLIRIYSDNTAKVSADWESYDDEADEAQKKAYYDYEILENDSSPITNEGRYSRAYLKSPKPYGLKWVNDPFEVPFYGTYPPLSWGKNGNVRIFGIGEDKMVIPKVQYVASVSQEEVKNNNEEVIRYNYNLKPNMKNAYMLSKDTYYGGTTDDPEMEMYFYPVFNAFYVELQCDEGSSPLVIDEVALSCVPDADSPKAYALSGAYEFSVGSGTWGDNGPLYTGVEYSSESDEASPYYVSYNVAFDLSKKVSGTTVSDVPESQRTIKPADTQNNTKAQSVGVTLLTLPPAGADSIKNVTLAVTYHYVGQTAEDATTSYLDLKYSANTLNGKFIEFGAFHKARITGLAMKGGFKWKLKVDAYPWYLVEKETTFSQNIQAKAFDIKNAFELTDEWINDPNGGNGKTNRYWPAGTKDYQIRTLIMDADYGVDDEGHQNKPYFEVTFKPMAPLGGYWQLIPESNGGLGTDAFKVEIWDKDENTGKYSGNADLKGQIMNQEVTLHITCNDDIRDVESAIIIKGIFSTSISFDANSTFSADSELQDVHTDGSFSYWRFVIPAKTTN